MHIFGVALLSLGALGLLLMAVDLAVGVVRSWRT